MLRRQITTLSALTFAAAGLAVAVSVVDPVAAQAGGGCHMDEGADYTEGTATVVRMGVCNFEPTVVRVPVGTDVRFLNTAPNGHAVSGRRNTWGSADVLAPGAEFSNRFTKAGIYPFSCPLHPGMVGTVIVDDGGQAAAAAPVAPIEADAAPASVAPATIDPAAAVPIVPAAIGAASGGLIGLVVGLLVSRRRPTAPASDTVRATPALDG